MVKSFIVALPYFPTGTMERIDLEGQVATAKVKVNIHLLFVHCCFVINIFSDIGTNALGNSTDCQRPSTDSYIWHPRLTREVLFLRCCYSSVTGLTFLNQQYLQAWHIYFKIGNCIDIVDRGNYKNQSFWKSGYSISWWWSTQEIQHLAWECSQCVTYNLH